VAEGVPAPRGKSLEIRGFGGKLSYEILFNCSPFRSSKTKVFKYKAKYLKEIREAYSSGIEAA
jgi:hypothetical protein